MIIQIITLILVAVLTAFLLFIIFGWRWLFKLVAKKFGQIIVSDSYQENLIELMPGIKHMGIQNVLENNLRAETGETLHRPMGDSKAWPHLEPLTFIPAQTTPFPVDIDDEVDVKVTIGTRAKKPLEIDIPLMISGMAYGLALSEYARIALSKAALNVKTAINTGEGAVLPEEMELGGKMILQFSKTAWSKDEKLFKQADMIEIKLGQGAMMGMGTKINPENLTGRARELMGLQEGEVAQIYEQFFENQTLEDLNDLLKELRKTSGGVPVGVKIAAGGKIEEDIDRLLQIGVDFIAIDGAQAATHGAPAILSGSFGIPTFHAVVRAANHLEKQKMKDKVSLIISGGLFTPGDFLKVLALGADAVYVGSALLFSVAHRQQLKPLPFEPPTQIVWNEGKFANEFDIEMGTTAATNYIKSSVEEIEVGIRAMGKRSLKEVTREDLVSYDENIAKMIGVPYSLEPWEKNKSSMKSGENNRLNEK